MKIPFLALVAALGFASTAHAATLYNCPANGTSNGWDGIDRGFYVTNYPGVTLDTVTLSYVAESNDGSYTIALTPHLGTYDGVVIGSTQQQTVALTAGNPGTPVTFNFGGAAVPLGSTVAFTQEVVSGPGDVGHDDGMTTPACPDVFETEETTPPLDAVRRNTIGLTITGAQAPQPAPASAPALGMPGFVLMIGAVLGLASLRRRFRRSDTEG